MNGPLYRASPGSAINTLILAGFQYLVPAQQWGRLGVLFLTQETEQKTVTWFLVGFFVLFLFVFLFCGAYTSRRCMEIILPRSNLKLTRLVLLTSCLCCSKAELDSGENLDSASGVYNRL